MGVDAIGDKEVIDAGDWSIFQREIAFCEKNIGRKMDLFPSRGSTAS